jgi:drug/metabolite transporter (DMT)-like permease
MPEPSTGPPTTSFDRARHLAGLALVALGTLLFAAKAVIVKLAYAKGAEPVSLLGLRMLFALPFFVLAALWTRRGSAPRPTYTEWWRIVAMGLLGYYLASFLDFLGLQYVSAGLERVILYLNPTLVLLGSVVLLRRRVSVREGWALAVTYGGVLIVFWHDLSVSGRDVPLGSLLVFASALAYAAYLLLAGELVERLGALQLTAWAGIAAGFVCLLQSLLWDAGALWRQSPGVYGLSAINGALSTALPIFMVMLGIERIGATAAAQAGMLGPAGTLVLASIWLDEPVTAAQVLGTGIVLLGVFILAGRRR